MGIHKILHVSVALPLYVIFLSVRVVFFDIC